MERLVRHLQEELEILKTRLLEMGGLAEERVRHSVQGLADRDFGLIDAVLAGDEPVNQLHIEIDDRVLKLLALHQPVAADLRAVMAAIKINTDLERVGDLAVNIAEAAKRYAMHPPVKKLIDIPRMADIAQAMLRDALDAYVKGDIALAQHVLNEDDKLDDAQDPDLPRAADLHAAGPAHHRAVAGSDPGVAASGTHRRPRHQRRRGRDFHGLGTGRPPPRPGIGVIRNRPICNLQSAIPLYLPPSLPPSYN